VDEDGKFSSNEMWVLVTGAGTTAILPALVVWVKVEGKRMV
jgi:hypothetical protein